jgi:hypothetical protein
MSTAIPDLWPESFGAETVTTPLSVLKMEASYLGQKTGQLVLAEVITNKNADLFVHIFLLAAPALDNYRYELFRVSHEITLYPINFYYKGSSSKLNSTTELVNQMGKVLQATETRSLIASLIAQSRS